MQLSHYITGVRKDHRPIFMTSVALLALTILMIIAMTIDHRELGGVSVWLKPIKFSLSIAIFLITVPYYISPLNVAVKRKNFLEKSILWLLIIEFLLIFVQAARGVKSHFNNSTFLDARVYNLMGLCIVLATIIMFVVLIYYVRPSTRPDMPKMNLYAHQVAIALFIFGCAIGGRMVGNFSNSVGTALQSGYIPITGWHLYIGDLRISHFMAVHSLQLVPIAVAFLSGNNALLVSLMMVVITLFFFFNAMAGNGLAG